MAVPNLGYLLVLPKFDYFAPKIVEEACSLLSQYQGKAKILAGGTDLLVSMKKRDISPRYLINIKSIPGLDYIKYSQEDGLKIGALATLHSVACSPIIKERFTILARACNKIGTLQVRNMGTIGGNICNGGPSQDSTPALLVLQAKLKLVSSQGQRIIPIDQFFISPFKTVLGEAELLTEIQIPTPPPRSAGSYHWLTKINFDDETLVGVATLLEADRKGEFCKDVRIGLCSVAPTPIRARRAEDLIRGKKIDQSLVEQAAQVAADETKPRSRADYRRQMTSLLVKRAINEVWQRLTT